MFHVLCRLGHGVSLNAAAHGMGLEGKPEGMNGRLAPALWAEGKREEVLRYVAHDARTTWTWRPLASPAAISGGSPVAAGFVV